MNRSITILIVVFLVITCTFSIFMFIKVSNSYLEIVKISKSIAEIEKEIKQKNSKLSSAELLLDNTNRILSTIYYGTADFEEKKDFKNFTGFSMFYREKYYLITAGHCIEYKGEKYENFRFKANNKNQVITPELLLYKNDYINNNDFAIFQEKNLITMGLIPASQEEDLNPLYILGNTEKDLNLIKKFGEVREGESGSPILNSKCHVIGIIIKENGEFTPINIVINAIDQLNN
jgi:hypothetical protein